MKRAILLVLSIMAICTILAGTVSAAKEGYGFDIGPGAVDATIDGTAAAGEWDTDSYKDFLYDGWTMTTSFFRDKWGQVPAINEAWLIEFIADTTNDASDYFKIYVDCSLSFGDPPEGGAAPTVNCWVLTVMGDGTASFQKGTGTAWTAFPDPVSGTDYIVATTVTGHRIYEIYLDKGATAANPLAMGYLNNARLEVYDASTGQTLMWPPESSADVPDTYGAGNTASETIPEVLTIGVMLALSTIAVIVSTRYFKKPKI